MELLLIVLAVIGGGVVVFIGIALLMLFSAAVSIAKSQHKDRRYEDPFSRL